MRDALTLFGSLRTKVAAEVVSHCNANRALLGSVPPLQVRILRFFLGDRGLLRVLFSYLALIALLIVLEVLVLSDYRDLVPQWTYSERLEPALSELNNHLLAAQITAIALLFPIAVALVTLIVQKEEATSTNSDVQVYYSQSLSYKIGLSGICLSIVLALQLFWPVHKLAALLDIVTSTSLSTFQLGVLHLAWLTANLVALWHFLVVSLSFVQPAKRAEFRKQFAASTAIPKHLTSALLDAHYFGLRQSLLASYASGSTATGALELHFGTSYGDMGVVEVANQRLVGKTLKDVWTAPLRLAVTRWSARSRRLDDSSPDSSDRASLTLSFPPDFRNALSKPGVLLRRHGGVALSAFEKFLVGMSFRY